MQPAIAVLLARFAEPADRAGAAAELAHRLGVDSILALFRDPERGVLVPAPGFPQNVPGGPAWRAFVKECARPGTHAADVDYPSLTHPARAVAHVAENGAALILFGGTPDPAAVSVVLELLPLLGATFRAERELEENDRRKDEFMAMLGHELRNPMAAISGAIEVMRARPPHHPTRIDRARAIIERQTEQLARLVDDLLDVARITRGTIALRLEPLEVETVVRRAVEAAHALCEAKNHVLTVDVRGHVHATADRTRLEQMVSNVVMNAAKYTDPGGHIRVVVRREGAHAVVEVEDDGIGIAPEMLPRIFDAFLQVDPSIDRADGGLGVGLTVVHRLAELHGGRVEVKSTEGKGSTFTLRIKAVDRELAATSSPVASARGRTAAEPAEPAEPADRKRARKRVLVVDDNVDSAEMMVLLAESWGHEAFHATDGPEAVTMAFELRPDVVLLDIGLPGMDGYEVAARLRDHPVTKGARIIAVSGYGLESDRARSRAAGCDEHLVKPVDIASLARVVGR